MVIIRNIFRNWEFNLIHFILSAVVILVFYYLAVYSIIYPEFIDIPKSKFWRAKSSRTIISTHYTANYIIRVSHLIVWFIFYHLQNLLLLGIFCIIILADIKIISVYWILGVFILFIICVLLLTRQFKEYFIEEALKTD